MSYEYMLGYAQGRRGLSLCISDDTPDSMYLAGYVKGRAMYDGDVLMHKQLVNRYNK